MVGGWCLAVERGMGRLLSGRLAIAGVLQGRGRVGWLARDWYCFGLASFEI